MTSPSYRLALPTLIALGLALAGCASKPAPRPGNAGHTTSTVVGATATTAKPKPAKPQGTPLPEKTGISACDDYLASYVACHRAAAIFPPDQIQGRYEDMRSSLLRDSMNPDVRPELGSRCTSLAISLRQALHGKSCDATNTAAPASTTNSR